MAAMEVKHQCSSHYNGFSSFIGLSYQESVSQQRCMLRKEISGGIDLGIDSMLDDDDLILTNVNEKIQKQGSTEVSWYVRTFFYCHLMSSFILESYHLRELCCKTIPACVKSVVPYGSKTWVVKEEDLAKLQQNEMMMVWWMCNVTLKDRKFSDELRSCGVGKHKKLHTKGYTDSWVKKCREIVIGGHRGRGRPQKTWDEVVQGDLRVLNIQLDLGLGRVKWKFAIK